MKVKLTSLNVRAPKRRIVVNNLPVVVGRNADADVRLDDQWVSRVHCEISEISGTLVVRDLGSHNGTLVNGQYIQEAHVLPGDRLTIGLNSFEVCYKRSPRRSLSAVAGGQC